MSSRLPCPATPGTAALVKRQARRLLELDREIKDIDKTITERFREHAYAHIIESLPGLGPGLGAEFLVITRLLCGIGPGAKGFRPNHR